MSLVQRLFRTVWIGSKIPHRLKKGDLARPHWISDHAPRTVVYGKKKLLYRVKGAPRSFRTVRSSCDALDTVACTASAMTRTVLGAFAQYIQPWERASCAKFIQTASSKVLLSSGPCSNLTARYARTRAIATPLPTTLAAHACFYNVCLPYEIEALPPARIPEQYRKRPQAKSLTSTDVQGPHVQLNPRNSPTRPRGH